MHQFLNSIINLCHGLKWTKFNVDDEDGVATKICRKWFTYHQQRAKVQPKFDPPFFQGRDLPPSPFSLDSLLKRVYSQSVMTKNSTTHVMRKHCFKQVNFFYYNNTWDNWLFPIIWAYFFPIKTKILCLVRSLPCLAKIMIILLRFFSWALSKMIVKLPEELPVAVVST